MLKGKVLEVLLILDYYVNKIIHFFIYFNFGDILIVFVLGK